MDFEINYDLPYFKDIYSEIKLNYPQFFNVNNVEINRYLVNFKQEYNSYIPNYNVTNDIFETYFNFIYFVKYIVSKDIANNNHNSDGTMYCVENLKSFKRWVENTENDKYKIPTMKLMLIMKYFEDIKLSDLISDYCNKEGRQSFTNFEYSEQLLDGMVFNEQTNRFEFTPEQRFKLLTGYYIKSTDSRSKYPIRVSSEQYYKLPVLSLSKLKDMFTKNVNIPYILYNNICGNFQKEYNSMLNVQNYDVHSDAYKSCMKFLYGPVKLCYLYSTSVHDYSNDNPYYSFVYQTLFEPFKEHYGYPFNKTDMINAVNDCNNRTNFDDFIYMKELFQ